MLANSNAQSVELRKAAGSPEAFELTYRLETPITHLVAEGMDGALPLDERRSRGEASLTLRITAADLDQGNLTNFTMVHGGPQATAHLTFDNSLMRHDD